MTSELSEEGTFWVQLQGEGAEVLDKLSERLQEEVSQVGTDHVLGAFSDICVPLCFVPPPPSVAEGAVYPNLLW